MLISKKIDALRCIRKDSNGNTVHLNVLKGKYIKRWMLHICLKDIYIYIYKDKYWLGSCLKIYIIP